MTDSPRELPPDVQRVLSHIEENVFDPELNVQRIKHACRLRDNNVSSRFRFFVGATIRDYLEARRMEAAAALLQEGGSTILDVAFAVGYNNLQTFYAAFRRRYSCTPDTYRREVRQDREGGRIGAIALFCLFAWLLGLLAPEAAPAIAAALPVP